MTPGCEWVLAGEGTPTRKVDGVCVLLDDAGLWWARREVKPGKAAPPNYRPVQTDPVTGKTVGWEPIEQSSFARYHAEAVERIEAAERDGTLATPGTYELIGPRINGNPERAPGHEIVPHGRSLLDGTRPPAELIDTCREHGWEGVVWHHPDGRMAKLKVRDYD